MNSVLKSKIVQNFIFFLCLSVFFAYLWSYRENVNNLFQKLGWFEAKIIFFSIAIQFGIRAWCERLHYHSIGYNIPISSLYSIFAKQHLLNYLPMKAGTIYSAAFLRKHYEISILHFSSVFAVQSILVLGTTLLAASITFFLNYLDKAENFITAIILAFFSFLVFSILFLRIPSIKTMPAIIKKYIETLNNGVDIYKNKPKILAATIILRFLAVLLMAWRFQILLKIGGQSISFSVSLVLSASILLSFLISITPAGLGIREALLAATSGLLMISSGITIIASVFERIFILLFSALILVIGNLYNYIKNNILF